MRGMSWLLCRLEDDFIQPVGQLLDCLGHTLGPQTLDEKRMQNARADSNAVKLSMVAANHHDLSFLAAARTIFFDDHDAVFVVVRVLEQVASENAILDRGLGHRLIADRFDRNLGIFAGDQSRVDGTVAQQLV